jgi:hypothetical protein
MRIVGLILVLLVLCSAVLSQDLLGGDRLVVFRHAVERDQVRLVRRKVPRLEQSGQLKAVLAESSKYLNLLQERSKDRPVPQDYAQSISEDIEIIENIRGRGIVGSTEWEQIKAVNTDLAIKAEHAEILPEAAFDSIEVIVRTKKNGLELSNYQVWYVKEAFKNDATKYRTFDRFSSPSSRKLPPGRYVMWSQATDGSKALGEKTPKEFGDGQANVEIDLAAP